MKVLLVTLAALIAAGTTSAATQSPCVYHGASTPAIVMETPDGAILSGAGAIGGCPFGTGSVAIHVCLQRDGVDVACQDYARAWSRYTRGARQAGGSLNADCAPGVWQTVVSGGDGFEPFAWASEAVTYVTSDESACRHI